MSDAPVRLVCPACAAPRPLEPATAPPPCPACGQALVLRDGVIVLDELPGCGEYPEVLAPLDFELEPRHWWHPSRNQLLADALARARAPGRRLVDLGCGTGFVLAHLERRGWRPLGLDMSLPALALARRRTAAPLIRSGRAAVPLADPVDVVLLCDVLEHADEAPLLSACREALVPGGLLVVSVPARRALWSTEDVAVGHRRRYERADLAAVLTDQGFRVERLQPFHAVVSLLAAGRRAAVQAPDDPVAWLAARRRPPGALSRRLLGAWLAVENRLGARVTLPLGSHLLALARRRD